MDPGCTCLVIRLEDRTPASTSSTISVHTCHFDREFQIPVVSWFHDLSWSRYFGPLSVCYSSLLLCRFPSTSIVPKKIPVNLLPSLFELSSMLAEFGFYHIRSVLRWNSNSVPSGKRCRISFHSSRITGEGDCEG
jgi:hypothetical protein